jgi:hypothetical protein
MPPGPFRTGPSQCLGKILAAMVKNFYNQLPSDSKVPLFDEKSGTLLIEKRHFTSRKAVLFFYHTPKALIISCMYKIDGKFGIYFTKSPFFRGVSKSVFFLRICGNRTARPSPTPDADYAHYSDFFLLFRIKCVTL